MSLKIVCTADLHLGLAEPPQAPAEVQRIRVDDGLVQFERVADYARHGGADFLVIGGDVFNTLRPSGYIFKRFCRTIGSLGAEGVQVLVVAGNHDKPRVTEAEPYLSALEEVRAPGYRFFKNSGIVILEGRRSGRRVRFLVLPYVYPMELGEETFIKYIRDTLAHLLSDRQGRFDYTVLVTHLVAEGSRLGVLKEIVPFSEPLVPKIILLQEGVDFILLGHLHNYQEIAEGMVYPGSIERISFSEEKESKGFIEVYEMEGKLRHRFIQLLARPLVTYPSEGELNLCQFPNPTESLIERLGEERIPNGALLRVRFRLGPRQHLAWDKVVGFLMEMGVLYALPDQVREKPALASELAGVVPNIEILLKKFVDQTLAKKLPPKIVRQVKLEGVKIIREVTEER